MEKLRAMAERLLMKVLESDLDQDFGKAVTTAAQLAYDELLKAGASEETAKKAGEYVFTVGVDVGVEALTILVPPEAPEFTHQ